MCLNVFCFAIAAGFNGTIETFVSQSFGAGNKRMCGVYLNRVRIMVSLALLPVFLMFIYLEEILVGIYHDPDISRAAATFVIASP